MAYTTQVYSTPKPPLAPKPPRLPATPKAFNAFAPEQLQHQNVYAGQAPSTNENITHVNQFAPGTPGAPKPPAPVAHAAAPTPPSPLDSTYFANVASNQFRVGNQLNQLNQTSGYAATDLQNALAKLSQQQPLDTLKDQEAANKQGLLYSGHLGQQLGLLNKSYFDRQAGLQDQFTRGQAARTSQVGALTSGLGIYDEGQRAAATERASLAAQKNPATGESSSPLVAAAAKKIAAKPALKPEFVSHTNRFAPAPKPAAKGRAPARPAPKPSTNESLSRNPGGS